MKKKYVNHYKGRWNVSLQDDNDRLFDRNTKTPVELVETLHKALTESYYCTRNAPDSYWDRFEKQREEAMQAIREWRKKWN